MLSRRSIERHLGPCLNQAISSCNRNPTLIFSGCPETTQLAARTASALGIDFNVVQGKVRTFDGKKVHHIWVELPDLDLRIETNASQVMGLPTFVMVLDLPYRADRYSEQFSNLEFLDRLTDAGENFYSRMARDVAACVRKKSKGKSHAR